MVGPDQHKSPLDQIAGTSSSGGAYAQVATPTRDLVAGKPNAPPIKSRSTVELLRAAVVAVVAAAAGELN